MGKREKEILREERGVEGHFFFFGGGGGEFPWPKVSERERLLERAEAIFLFA